MMRRHRIRTVSAIGLLAVAALVLTPAVAHADGWRTVTATGEGIGNNQTALNNAEVNARIKLISQAMQAREMCTSITTSSELQWYDPYREYFVARGTATGYCAVTPPYTVFRASAPHQASSNVSGQDALARADAQARADVLAVGVNCTNWLGGSRLVYASGSFVVMEATEWALCTN